MNRWMTVLAVLTMVVNLSGCSHDGASNTTVADRSTSVSAAERARFLLADEPAGAAHVIDVREAAEDGQEVVVFGRIGGSNNPWIDERAAFWIVDDSLKACSDIPGDNCPKPWDYCCATDQLPGATVLVKLVDDQGRLVKHDARDVLGVNELDKVVVKGEARRDDADNLTILAQGIYVRE